MNYQELPADSRVWIYQSDRIFSEQDISAIRQLGVEFVGNWATHGTPLRAALEIFHDRFIVVFLDEDVAKPGGCSIDKSVRLMKKIEEDYNCTLLDRMQIAYRENDAIETMHLDAFRKALNSELLNAETRVFNNLVTNKEAFETLWEVPVKDSWHAQLMS